MDIKDIAMELLVILLRNQAEDACLRIRERAINQIVEETLKKLELQKEITSTEYQSALDILKRYKTTEANQG